jgi:hypothetical protein
MGTGGAEEAIRVDCKVALVQLSSSVDLETVGTGYVNVEAARLAGDHSGAVKRL